MIESIELEKCTGCGICDVVSPADVIHMEPQPVAVEIAGLRQTRLLPVIKFREHCITCFSCEIFCPERIVDVHPSVKNRRRRWGGEWISSTACLSTPPCGWWAGGRAV